MMRFGVTFALLRGCFFLLDGGISFSRDWKNFLTLVSVVKCGEFSKRTIKQ